MSKIDQELVVVVRRRVRLRDRVTRFLGLNNDKMYGEGGPAVSRRYDNSRFDGGELMHGYLSGARTRKVDNFRPPGYTGVKYLLGQVELGSWITDSRAVLCIFSLINSCSGHADETADPSALNGSADVSRRSGRHRPPPALWVNAYRLFLPYWKTGTRSSKSRVYIIPFKCSSKDAKFSLLFHTFPRAFNPT